MEKRLDNSAVAAIVTGTILLIITDYYMFNFPSLKHEWGIVACAVIVMIIAAIYGAIAGALVPFAASVVTGVAFMGLDVLTGFLVLLLFGIATGNYVDKLEVRKGGFAGIRIFDFCMLEIALTILAWICVYPLERFYVYKTDIRSSLDEGVLYCGVSILMILCICLPVLIVCNRLFHRKRLLEDAGKEYLYERK